MLPISDVKFAKSINNKSNIDWILFDVYKIAPHYPLEVSIYGYVFNEHTVFNIKNPVYQTIEMQRVRIADKFLNKSLRDNLKGLKLTCGLVVCIHYLNVIKSHLIIFSLFHTVKYSVHISRTVYISWRPKGRKYWHLQQSIVYNCSKCEGKFEYEVKSSDAYNVEW